MFVRRLKRRWLPKIWTGAAICISGCAWTGNGDLTGGLAAALPQSALPQSAEGREQWWRTNQGRAEFVPGKGFAVDGVPGFFDKQGRPIHDNVQHVSYDGSEASDDGGSLLTWDTLQPSQAYQKLKQAVGQGPDEILAKKLFASGEAQFRAKEYSAAASKYRRAAERWPDSALEQDAMFMLGESHFFSDDYPEASDAFDALLKKYPSSRHLDSVIKRQFAVASYWEKYHQARPSWPIVPNVTDGSRHIFDTWGHALKVYENIRLNDPTGPLADDALMATANAYFARGRYDDADYHYGLLRREYPQSEHQFKAHLLGLMGKLRRYQGADYDGTVLDEADKLVDQLLRQFPGELNDERERIVRVRAEVNRLHAERELRRADDYAKRKYYGAARYHYQRLVEKYPETRLADFARSQLAEFQGRPDSPPERFVWLNNLLSDGEEKTSVANAAGGSGTRRQ